MRVPKKKNADGSKYGGSFKILLITGLPVIIKISNLASVDFVKSNIFLQYLTYFVYSNKLKTTVNLNNGLLIRALY